MQTIRELLNRIRWDEEFGRGNFRIGYYDRLDKCEVEAPFCALRFPDGDHFAVEISDSEGTAHSVPLHRICSVSRDGELIWSRPRCDGTLSRRRRR